MLAEQRTRALLRAADPVRGVDAPPPRLSAADLIARAEVAAEPDATGRPRVSRRLVLVAGSTTAAAAAYAVVTSVLERNGPAAPPAVPGAGVILAPIAYQIDQDPPPAADHLRDLAGRLTDAPYENHPGQYSYHRVKAWGDPLAISEDGHVMGYVTERQTWQLADGSGLQRTTALPPEYPDHESRDYWTRRLPPRSSNAPSELLLEPKEIAPLPSDPAGLAGMLNVRFGAGDVAKQVITVFSRYVVPKQTRVQILNVLADVPGFAWRGTVTDRAGRRGVAITYDDGLHQQQSLLVFDAKTGVVLAHELLSAAPRRLSTYMVILDTDRTDRPG
jgi:hypothetical protein